MRGADLSRFIIIRQADGSEREFSEQDLPLSFGSDPENHLVLTGADPFAAFVGEYQGHLFIQPADEYSTPLFHNGRRLTDSVWLKSNDELRFHAHVIYHERQGDRLIFTVSETAQAAPTGLSPPAHPPPGVPSDNGSATAIPVEVNSPAGLSGRRLLAQFIFGLCFLLLCGAVLFVLLARPLELEITPAADSVSISGFPPAVKIGERYLLLPRTYAVMVGKDGYRTYRKEVQISSMSDNFLKVDLEKLPGILKLKTTPPDGVEVYSGSEFLGSTPPHELPIASGAHRLILKKERFQPYETDLWIEGKEVVQTVEADLSPDWADISITSDPDGADVIVDGAAVGFTPITLSLLSGSHQLELRRKHHVSQIRMISVQAGRDISFGYDLTPLPAQLSLSSAPPGAVISIEGKYQGTTPLTVELPSAVTREITLSRPGYKSLTHGVKLGPGEQKQISLELEQEQGIVFMTIIPAEASVTINGIPYGTIDGELTLPAAAQTIKISAPGYRSVSRTITPNPGFSQKLLITLQPESAVTGSPSPPVAADQPFTAAGGQRLQLINPSDFTMGAPRREPGRRANERERNVVMRRPFLLSEKLVTNAEYREFNSSHSSGSFGGYSLDGENQPVVNVTWDQAVDYLNWLSERDNLEPFYIKQGQQFVAASPPTNGYRLPTEAEWAYSARLTEGNDGGRYPWSGGFPPRSVVANLGDESARVILPRVIGQYNDTFPVTSPVGYFPANQAGLYDIGGNAAEWCHDFYSAYTGRLGNEPDPLGPPGGAHKVIRGSSWKDASVTEVRSSYRGYHREARNNVGFRIARYP